LLREDAMKTQRIMLLVAALCAPFVLAGHCGHVTPVDPSDADASQDARPAEDAPPALDAAPEAGTDAADTGSDSGARCPRASDSPCALGCQKLCLLTCPGWNGTPGGDSCVTVCEDTESSGVAHFCPTALAAMHGKASDAGPTCDLQEIQTAFESCGP
jgi:hypothetical protein